MPKKPTPSKPTVVKTFLYKVYFEVMHDHAQLPAGTEPVVSACLVLASNIEEAIDKAKRAFPKSGKVEMASPEGRHAFGARPSEETIVL